MTTMYTAWEQLQIEQHARTLFATLAEYPCPPPDLWALSYNTAQLFISTKEPCWENPQQILETLSLSEILNRLPPQTGALETGWNVHYTEEAQHV